MRTLTWIVVAAIVAGAALAQDDAERKPRDVAKDLLAQAEALAGHLSGIRSAADARRLALDVERASTRVQVLSNELSRIPEWERAAAVEPLEDRMGQLGASIAGERTRVRSIPDAWSALRNIPYFVEEDERICVSRLKQLGLAVVLYQQKNNEFLPSHGNPAFLKALLDGGFMMDLTIYVCPGSQDEPAPKGGPFTTSFATWSEGPKITSGMLARFGSRIPLLWDAEADHHPGVRHVLFCDGHVETYAESAFEGALRFYETPDWKFKR